MRQLSYIFFLNLLLIVTSSSLSHAQVDDWQTLNHIDSTSIFSTNQGLRIFKELSEFNSRNNQIYKKGGSFSEKLDSIIYFQ